MSRNSITRPNITSLSLHQLAYLDEELAQPFSWTQYSRYKYGASSIGEAYATALDHTFWQRFPNLALSHRLLISSPAYKSIPTSAFCIAQAFWKLLNLRRKKAGIAASHLIKIERTTLYPGDYGTLAADQRIQVMERNSLHIEGVSLDDANLILVDDSKITGAHEQCIVRHIESLALRSLTFLYIIECGNAREIAGGASIEDRLNHASVKTLRDLATIIASPDFLFNVRVCKYILNPINRADLPAFLDSMSDNFLTDLYQKSLQDGYCFMGIYQESLHMLHTVLQKRHLALNECKFPQLEMNSFHSFE